jgi:hypothetical protein
VRARSSPIVGLTAELSAASGTGRFRTRAGEWAGRSPPPSHLAGEPDGMQREAERVGGATNEPAQRSRRDAHQYDCGIIALCGVHDAETRMLSRSRILGRKPIDGAGLPIHVGELHRLEADAGRDDRRPRRSHELDSRRARIRRRRPQWPAYALPLRSVGSLREVRGCGVQGGE